jgi:hypothetical protein
MKPLSLLLVLLVAAGVSAANLPVKRFALFVGANQGGAAQQPLLYAQKDALKMQQVMQEVGGVTAADRILLLDPTPDDVAAALAALASRVAASTGPDSRRTEFLFYYSGHSDEEGLLLGDRSLSYRALRDGLQTVGADVRIAILDSCSSGAFARLKGGVQRAPFLGQDGSQMKGHAFLTSSSENEASQESDTLQGSFFTHFLVSGLRGGADRAGDGLITLDEAYEYAFQNTLARTESTRAGPQHPSYEIQLSGTGNLVLSDVKTATARLEVASDVSGKLYVRNAAGQLFAEVAKDEGTPLALALPPGTYSVTAVTPKKSLSARVVLSGQTGASVAQHDFQEQELARFAVRGPAPEPTTPDDTLAVDLAPFSLGLIPGLPGSGWGGRDKTVALSALVDFANAVRGFQASGLISLNARRFEGLQASGIGSISSGPVSGFQSGGVFSIASEGIQGFQTAGIFTLAGGKENGFWQSAGVFNLSRGTFRGLQTAGVVNIADSLQGAQLGVVNIAGDVKGLQVGLVNINRHIEGAGLGLIFVSPDAYYHPLVLYDDKGKTHGLFQWGMGWLYWLTGVVADSKTAAATREWDQLGGVGVKVQNRFVFWDTDAGWSDSFRAEVWTGGRPYLRSSVGLQSGWAAVEAGVLVTPDASGRRVTVGPLDVSVSARWFAGLRFF